MESRLAETEVALYQALAKLHYEQGTEIPSINRVTTKEKLGLMDEWQQFPLGTEEDQYKWYICKGQKESLQLSDRDMSSPSRTEGGPEMMLDTELHMPRRRGSDHSPIVLQAHEEQSNILQQPDWTGNEISAQAYAAAHKNMYF